MRYAVFVILTLSLNPLHAVVQSWEDYGRWPGTITLRSGNEIPYVELYRAVLTGDIPNPRADFVVSVDQFLTARQVEEFLCRFIGEKGGLIPASLGASVHIYHRLSFYGGISLPYDEPLIAFGGCRGASRSHCWMRYYTDEKGTSLGAGRDLEFSCEGLGGQSFPQEDQVKDPD